VGTLACALVIGAAGSLAVAGISEPFRDEHAEDDSKIVVKKPSHAVFNIRFINGRPFS
jgi:hypothetical protein